MSKPEGIYLCVDYRVTDSRTDGVLDDAAPKILQVTFPLPGWWTEGIAGLHRRRRPTRRHSDRRLDS